MEFYMNSFIRIVLFILLCISKNTFINAMTHENALIQHDNYDSNNDAKTDEFEPSPKNQPEQCCICQQDLDISYNDLPRNLPYNDVFNKSCKNCVHHQWLQSNKVHPMYETIQPSHSVKKLSNLLHDAATNGDIVTTTTLLNEGIKINSRDAYGYTALHLAASNGHNNVITLLLDRHACINSEDFSGYTALHLAVLNGFVQTIALLLDKGANINTKNHAGFTALDLAKRHRHTEIITLLLNREANSNAEVHTALDLAEPHINPITVQHRYHNRTTTLPLHRRIGRLLCDRCTIS